MPLLDDGRDRAAHVLEGASRSPARASATRSPRASVAAELNARQAPAPVSTLAAALALAALAVAARRRAGDRGARAAGRRRCARSGSPPLPSHGELPLRPGRRRARRSATRCCARGSSCARTTTAIRITIRDRVDDDLLVETLARAARPAGAGRRRRRRGACGTCARPPRRASPCGSASTARAASRVDTGAGHLRPLPRAARVPRRPRPRASRAPATSRPATTTRSRTRRSRSARRSTARSATAAGSPATATRSCRWTTRSPAPRSTSAAGRTRS